MKVSLQPDITPAVWPENEKQEKLQNAPTNRGSPCRKWRKCSIRAAHCLIIFLILFVYLCALNNLSSAFSILGTRGLGRAIQNSPLIDDPISAVIVGMLATVVLQSATTTSNVIVSMVAAEMITVHEAIPVMMGSDLGSSVVNALLSLAYSGHPKQFGRAFAAATLADVFNVCCLFVILPLELAFGFIEKIGWFIVDPLIAEKGISFKTMELLTDPINQLILQVNDVEVRKATVDDEYFPTDHSFLMRCVFTNGSRIPNCPYKHLFAYSLWTDSTIGLLVLISSVLVLIGCLVGIVYTIQRLLSGAAGRRVNHLITKDCPGSFKCCTGFIIMVIGLFLTMIIQSNSIFSSSLTPLVGSGVITLDKMYPLILGSNIGATFSGVLAALSADGSQFEKTLHMAVCQVIYNIMGTLCFYPIPFTRRIPISISTKLGETVAQHRWFIVVFLLFFFVFFPIVVIGLTLLPPACIVVVFSLVFVLVLLFCSISLMQSCCPQALPACLRNWEWVPLRLRSLEPYDELMTNLFTSIPCVGGFFEKYSATVEEESSQDSDKIFKEATV